jgi:hypothetical protein
MSLFEALSTEISILGGLQEVDRDPVALVADSDKETIVTRCAFGAGLQRTISHLLFQKISGWSGSSRPFDFRISL